MRFRLSRRKIRWLLQFRFSAWTVLYVGIHTHFVLWVRRQQNLVLILSHDVGIQLLLWLLISMEFAYILFLSLGDFLFILFYLGLLELHLVFSLLFKMRLHVQIRLVLPQNIFRRHQALLAVRIVEVRRLMLAFHIRLMQDIQIRYALWRIRGIGDQYDLAVSGSKRRHCLLLLF